MPTIAIDAPGPPETPGASTPPLAIVTATGSTVPVPVSAPSALTVTPEVPVSAPSTTSVPPATMVGPVKDDEPVSVSVPAKSVNPPEPTIAPANVPLALVRTSVLLPR